MFRIASKPKVGPKVLKNALQKIEGAGYKLAFPIDFSKGRGKNLRATVIIFHPDRAKGGIIRIEFLNAGGENERYASVHLSPTSFENTLQQACWEKVVGDVMNLLPPPIISAQAA